MKRKSQNKDRLIMDGLVASIVLIILLSYLWITSTGRRMKARIRRIRNIHGPDATIWYMNLKGRRSTRKITIESVAPKGRDWEITAWCHDKKDFFVFCASRIYKYFDLNQQEEINNVIEYFSQRAECGVDPRHEPGSRHKPAA